MTIYPLQVGKTYRTRDGKAEHTINRIDNRDGFYGPVAWSPDNKAWWANTGKSCGDTESPDDLVEEVHPTAPTAEGPVRRRTVTEIVPGLYGRLRVIAGYSEGYGEPVAEVGFVNRSGVDIARSAMIILNAGELDALAAIATQLAVALRAIAAEKGTDQ